MFNFDNFSTYSQPFLLVHDQGREEAREAHAQAMAADSGGPLVSTSISQSKLEVYRSSVRVIRPGTGNRNAIPPDRSSSAISGFSTKSKSRLRHCVENADPSLISQMGLTYHDNWPTDGRECKRHLRLFLDILRQCAPGILYLWILEFQKRNAPHFHVFFTILPDSVLWEKLSRAWVTITSGTDDALWWHSPERGKTWIPWEMKTSGYLTKYLDKDCQKFIPDGYLNFGRFWGCSRDLVPEPITIPTGELSHYDQIDNQTGNIIQGENFILRSLGRLAERKTKGYSRFRTRAFYSSYTMHGGAVAFHQLEKYLHKLKNGGKNGV
jgi:hypothetical protein